MSWTADTEMPSESHASGVADRRMIVTAVWGAVAYSSVGVVVFGVLLLRTTVTCTPEVTSSSVCLHNPLGPWGSWIALIGVSLLIVSLASFAKYSGSWRATAPEPFAGHHLSDTEAVAAGRAERRTHRIILGGLTLVLVAVEAVPIDALYAETTSPPRPTFDPAAFVAVLMVAGVADFLVLFLIHVFLANR